MQFNERVHQASTVTEGSDGLTVERRRPQQARKGSRNLTLTAEGIEVKVTRCALAAVEGLIQSRQRNQLEETNPEEQLLHGTATYYPHQRYFPEGQQTFEIDEQILVRSCKTLRYRTRAGFCV